MRVHIPILRLLLALAAALPLAAAVPPAPASAATCAIEFASLTVAPASTVAGANTDYTITALTPNKIGCNIVSGSTAVTLAFPAGTDAGGVTGGTFAGAAISFSSLFPTSVVFVAPANVKRNASVSIVLTGVINPGGGSYTLDAGASPAGGGGQISTTSSSAYAIAGPTPTPTSSPTATPTVTPGGPTLTPTATSTPTPPAGTCSSPLQYVNVAPSNPTIGQSSSYTIDAKTPSTAGCNITTSTLLSLDFPGTTDVSAA